MKAHWRAGIGTSAVAVILLLMMAIACGGGKNTPEGGTPTQAPEASAEATTPSPSLEPTSSPSPTGAPLSWRDVDEIVAAVQLCPEYLVTDWNVDANVSLKWALPTLAEMEKMLAEDKPASSSDWHARITPMGDANEALVKNYAAILFWLEERYGEWPSGDKPSGGYTPLLDSMTGEADWTPLFVQCIAAQLGAISVATPEAVPSVGAADALGDGFLLLTALTFDINFTPYPEWLRLVEVCERIMGRVDSDQVLRETCIEYVGLTGLTSDQAIPKMEAMRSRLEEWLLQQQSP